MENYAGTGTQTQTLSLTVQALYHWTNEQHASSKSVREWMDGQLCIGDCLTIWKKMLTKKK